MNELAIREQTLPDNIDDLAKFLLIMPERLVALKAEIRAIQKANVAKHVLEQKEHEERMIAELVLDAKAKLGALTKALPTASGARTDIKPTDTAVVRSKPKSEAIRELGFSQKQVKRMEVLADNPDLVEYAKREAREKNVAPTATRVIDLAQARKKAVETDIRKIDADFDNLKKFRKAISNPALFGLLDAAGKILPSVVAADSDFAGTIKDIDDYITALSVIKSKLLLLKGDAHEET